MLAMQNDSGSRFWHSASGLGTALGASVAVVEGCEVHLGTAHLDLAQLLAMQSVSDEHNCPIAHPRHDAPPQSVSVSSPF
jgi:hypothetical protein